MKLDGIQFLLLWSAEAERMRRRRFGRDAGAPGNGDGRLAVDKD